MSEPTKELEGPPFDYDRFRGLVEQQDLKSLRKFLDYDKRIKAGGLAELSQWIGKILLDDG